MTEPPWLLTGRARSWDGTGREACQGRGGRVVVAFVRGDNRIDACVAGKVFCRFRRTALILPTRPVVMLLSRSPGCVHLNDRICWILDAAGERECGGVALVLTCGPAELVPPADSITGACTFTDSISYDRLVARQLYRCLKNVSVHVAFYQYATQIYSIVVDRLSEVH